MIHMRLVNFWSVLSVTVVAVGVFGCDGGRSHDDGDAATVDAGRKEIVGIAENVFPADTLTDWVSFAEFVSAVHVLSETEEQDESNEEAGEGYVARLIELRIEATIWHRPGDVAQVDTLDLATLGWQTNGGKKRVIVVRDAPRLEVGGRYVIAISRLGTYWIPLTGGSVFAVAGDRVASADLASHGNSPLAKMLGALSNEEIRALLEATEPYPEAAMDWSAPPLERLRAVRQAEEQARSQ